jgi:hypothetical protein
MSVIPPLPEEIIASHPLIVQVYIRQLEATIFVGERSMIIGPHIFLLHK